MPLKSDSHILSVVCRPRWRLRRCMSLLLRLWHMSCWAGDATSPSPDPPSLYFTERERNMLSFYALHSLLVLSSHCNTAVFQHTNNRDCGGSSPPYWAANHPGVTACQGTVSLRPQLRSPPGSAIPAPLINPRPTQITLVQSEHILTSKVPMSACLNMPICHFFFFCSKGKRSVVCLKSRLQLQWHAGIRCGCEGEDRFNGEKRIDSKQNIGVIYSLVYAPARAASSSAFALVICNKRTFHRQARVQIKRRHLRSDNKLFFFKEIISWWRPLLLPAGDWQ